MSLKTSQAFLIILWLSLFILLFHELHFFKSKIITNTNTNTFSFPSHRPPITRKLATKFDFTPFLKHRHNHHRQKQSPEMDPRYGVEKRLVPTGPNPLHH
ncbi:CLE13p like [Actinidia chinensis var. chinensis]|uniref:CLE13p like n=1 Tax=Actinidia chinensis var. chinensis TaxID=1590841 RepID=A0A2R6P497_ACTCC|nr:CLE13p like [Actinidia chinensis var. chinensis]